MNVVEFLIFCAAYDLLRCASWHDLQTDEVIAAAEIVNAEREADYQAGRS